MLVGIQDELLRLHLAGWLKGLLVDKTSKANIIWATDAYRDRGPDYSRDRAIEARLITGDQSDVIKNRARKAMEHQSERTRKHAEVFTPLWVCQKMVSAGDREILGRDPFLGDDAGLKAFFAPDHAWQAYIKARRLEITCGEAPFLVQRYDAASGEVIPLADRQGLLDRKLRLVSLFTDNEKDWFTWACRAFQATYGYEFQGDNLLIARLNLLMTLEDVLKARWGRQPTGQEYRKIINIISWNIWQMDGLTGGLPFAQDSQADRQIDLFSLFETPATDPAGPPETCRIYNWSADHSLNYQDLTQGGKTMKFDFIIGNPPYQETIKNKGDRPNPIYHNFMEESFDIADVVTLITPARFLFNAGQTPKKWNEKMLKDPHFKIVHYESDASKVFPGTDIKGGVAISIRDNSKEYDAVEVFSPYVEMNGILQKILKHPQVTFLDMIVASRGNYRLSPKFFEDFPSSKDKLGKGTGNMLVSNFFEKIPEANIAQDADMQDDIVNILCRVDGRRTKRKLKKVYIQQNDFIEGYNIASPEANGSGKFGEKLAPSEILSPQEGATDTFISIGIFSTKAEAQKLQRYMATKFFRALLGVKKVTQHCPPSVWKYVPLQDFTLQSDIDWSRSVADIDRQLYAKYGLSEEEVAFIESHVKEMV
ncbi:Eco57I restriction-modification methylase domain-containing protein [Peptococcus simiae]|uniref:Eco57I restriction-modification methylase domain-containing protein n=1 Tax=Peptococcus simiae TaxID=1643805 RepID=UPI00397F5A22